MTKYLFIYHAPMPSVEAAPARPDQTAATKQEWNSWAGQVGDGMIDFGTPLAGGQRIGAW